MMSFTKISDQQNTNSTDFSHHQAIQRAERAHEQQLRRIASNMAKEVRGFWGNIEKLFEFRLKSQIEKKRKIAMDEHLVWIYLTHNCPKKDYKRPYTFAKFIVRVKFPFQ